MRFILPSNIMQDSIREIIAQYHKSHPLLIKLLGEPSEIKLLRQFSASIPDSDETLTDNQVYGLVKIILDSDSALFKPLKNQFFESSDAYFKVWKSLDIKNRILKGLSFEYFCVTCDISPQYLRDMHKALAFWGRWLTPETFQKMCQHPQHIVNVNKLIMRGPDKNYGANWWSSYISELVLSGRSPSRFFAPTFIKAPDTTYIKVFINNLYQNLDKPVNDLEHLVKSYKQLEKADLVSAENINHVTKDPSKSLDIAIQIRSGTFRLNQIATQQSSRTRSYSY